MVSVSRTFSVSASISALVALMVVLAALAATRRNGPAFNASSVPAPSDTDPVPLKPATTPGGLKPSPSTVKVRSKGPVARIVPVRALDRF